MARFKTFNSTGVAPDGVLYAGDENAMQDRAAELANFAQTVDLGTLRIGEAALQLIKYAVGEARITGLLRVDGILRGLGGLFAGTFTTAQRDAIAAGSRPFGLIILNTTTSRLEMNFGTDATPNWKPLSGDWGYVEQTGSFSVNKGEAEAPVIEIFNILTITCDGSPMWVEMFLPQVSYPEANVMGFDLLIDSTVMGLMTKISNIPTAAPIPVFAKKKVTPAAGSRQFTVRVFRSGTISGTITCGAGGNSGGLGVLDPAYLRVSKA